MYVQVKKTKKNKSRAIANSVGQKKNNVKLGSEFVDNWSETIKYRKMHYKVDDFCPKYIGNFSKNLGLLQCVLQPQRQVIQKKGTVEEFLNRVVWYVEQLERYSHQGYPRYGKRTRGDVEKSRQELIEYYNQLDSAEKVRLKQSNSINWNQVSDKYHWDLVYFHATNLHLNPINSVSYYEGVSEYHQKHLGEELAPGKSQNPNYATLYYDISIQFNMAGKARYIRYFGSYAGRSGKYDNKHTIEAPANQGYEQHQVAPSVSFYFLISKRAEDSKSATGKIKKSWFG